MSDIKPCVFATAGAKTNLIEEEKKKTFFDQLNETFKKKTPKVSQK